MDLKIDIILELSYDEYVDILLEKYGRVPGDYFTDSSFRKKNKKINRSKDGLWCHHIDEDKVPNLSRKPVRVRDYIEDIDPFEYQKAERLVYCNYIEHMLLHMKIVEKELTKPYDEPNNVFVVGLYGFETLANKIDKVISFPFSCIKSELTKTDEVNYKMLDEKWITLYVMSIKRFVEKIENSPEYIAWISHYPGRRLSQIHRIYIYHPINYGETKTLEEYQHE